MRDARVEGAVLGAITGVRSMAGITTIARLTGGGRSARKSNLRSGFSVGSAVLAAGELIADKVADLPARTEMAPLTARGVLGAVTAGVVAKRSGSSLVEAAVIGGATALLAAFVATRLRRVVTHRLGVPDAAVGLAEDALVVAGSAWVLGDRAKRR